jgi:hypothetical protein
VDRQPVSSSSLASVGYDGTKNTLEIEFKHGSIYQYYDVPAKVHAGLMNASSMGRYFHANIKNAGYRYRQIR